MEQHRDRIISNLAAEQHGAIARHQLLALGVLPRTIRRWGARGRLQAVAADVYIVGGTPATWRQRLMVATLSQGPMAVASHRAAAHLWGLLDRDDPRPEVTAPRHLRRHRDVIVHESSKLPVEHVTRVDGIPTTSVARTLIDLCAVIRPAQASLAYDAAVRRRLVTPAAVDDAIGRIASRGRPGIRLARLLTERRLAGHVPGASTFEDLVFELLVAHGLVGAVRNHVVHDEEGPLEIDIAYPESKVGVEPDGRDAHLSEMAFVWDRDKQSRLAALGWTVLRVPWDTYRRRPQFIVRKVRQVLEARRRAAA
jgi:very-short-patch-repair endonuclease